MAKNTIILLEDDIVLRQLYALVLTDAGYEIIEDDSSKDILKLIKNKQPALIISDLYMPGHDGVEGILEAISQYNIPIIAISADKEHLNTISFLVSKTLEKPFLALELVTEVKKLLA